MPWLEDKVIGTGIQEGKGKVTVVLPAETAEEIVKHPKGQDGVKVVDVKTLPKGQAQLTIKTGT